MENPLLAFENVDFMKSDACREMRLELEHLHPDVVMEEQDVKETIVLFGSARIPAADEPSGTTCAPANTDVTH